MTVNKGGCAEKDPELIEVKPGMRPVKSKRIIDKMCKVNKAVGLVEIAEEFNLGTKHYITKIKDFNAEGVETQYGKVSCKRKTWIPICFKHRC